MLNPTHLRAFHAVATEGSFSRAARALNVGQPTLSAQVKALEETYGVRLFDRRGRGVVLTELGRALADVSTRIETLRDQAEALLSGAQNLARGTLAVGADSPRHAMELCAGLKQRHPGLQVRISMGNRDGVLASLTDYRVDVALLSNVPVEDRLFALPYRRSPLAVVVRRDHPLAGHKRLRLAQLLSHEIVVRERPSITREVFERAVAKAGLDFPAALEIETREAVREAVLAGLGASVVVTAEHEEHADLRLISLEADRLDVAEYVVCLRARRRLATIRAFLELASDMAGDAG